MNSVLQPLLDRGVVVYLDDILIYSRTAEEHLELIREVLSLLRKHRLYAEPEKCRFGLSQTEFLGHVVDQAGTFVNP